MLELVEGDKGAGKNVYTTYRALLAYKDGRPVFCNYKLNFPYQKINLEDMMHNTSQLHDAIIIIDDAHNYFDAREFMSKKNQIFAKFQAQSRKRHVDLLLVSQQYENIDLRIRKNTDVITTCKPYRLVMRNGTKTLRPCNIEEIETHKVSMIFIRKNLIWAGGEIQWLRLNPSRYFNLYDSDEWVDI